MMQTTCFNLLNTQVHLSTTKFNTNKFNSNKFNSIAICLLFRTNLQRETATYYALLPRILTLACEKYPTMQKLNAYLDELGGATLVAEPIKKGEEQIISLYITAPNMYTGKLFELLSELVYSPAGFTQPLVHTACRALSLDIADKLNNKRSYVLEKMLAAMCCDEPFGISADGYIADLSGITAKELYTRYINMLKNSMRELYIVGDISRAEAESYIKAHFKAHDGAVELKKVGYIAKSHPINYVREKSRAVQSVAAIGIRTNSNDYARLLLANEVLGGSSNSRLFAEIREKKGLCYYISSHLYRYKGIICVETGINRKDMDEVVSCVEWQLHAISAKNVTAKELKAAKESLTAAFGTIQDNPARLADFMLSIAVAGESISLDKIIDDINAVADLKGVFDNAFIDTILVMEGNNDV